MIKQDPFYDKVFGNAGEDLLLALDPINPTEDAIPEKSPSWMSDRGSENGDTSATDQKTLLMDLNRDSDETLQAVNEALGQGWKLVNMSLTQPIGEQGAPSHANQLVMTLQPDSPRSLFDFGG